MLACWAKPAWFVDIATVGVGGQCSGLAARMTEMDDRSFQLIEMKSWMRRREFLSQKVDVGGCSDVWEEELKKPAR